MANATICSGHVDHEGEVVKCFVSKRHDRKAALKFLRKTMKRFGRLEVLVIDKLHSYRAVLRVLSSERLHCTDRWRTIVLKTDTAISTTKTRDLEISKKPSLQKFVSVHVISPH